MVVVLRTQLPARHWLDYLASAALAIPGLVLAIGYLRMFKGVNLVSMEHINPEGRLCLVCPWQ